MTALVSTEVQVTVGVDTHADVHVAAALDQLGRLLATRSVPSTVGRPGPGRIGRCIADGRTTWDRGHRQLWDRARPLAAQSRVRGAGGGTAEAPEPPSARKVRKRLMPRQLRARCRLERRPPSPKLATVRSRCCAPSRPLAGRPSRHARRPLVSCTRSSLLPRIASALACAGSAVPRLVATAVAFRPRLPLTSTITATQLALTSLGVLGVVSYRILLSNTGQRGARFTHVWRNGTRRWLRGIVPHTLLSVLMDSANVARSQQAGIQVGRTLDALTAVALRRRASDGAAQAEAELRQLVARIGPEVGVPGWARRVRTAPGTSSPSVQGRSITGSLGTLTPREREVAGRRAGADQPRIAQALGDRRGDRRRPCRPRSEQAPGFDRAARKVPRRYPLLRAPLRLLPTGSPGVCSFATPPARLLGDIGEHGLFDCAGEPLLEVENANPVRRDREARHTAHGRQHRPHLPEPAFGTGAERPLSHQHVLRHNVVHHLDTCSPADIQHSVRKVVGIDRQRHDRSSRERLHLGRVGRGPHDDLPPVPVKPHRQRPWSKSNGLTVKRAVRQGDAAVEFALTAQERDAAAVVMATHGRTGLAHTLMGGVAGKILHNSACPVIVVRPAQLRGAEEPVPVHNLAPASA
jgi:Universal stress protein family